MPNQGPNGPSGSANVTNTGSFASWVNPSNIGSSDLMNATSDITGSGLGGFTDYLQATSFGFTIPAGATIDGISVRWWKSKSNGTDDIVDQQVRIVKGGAIGTTERADTVSQWPSTTTEVDYGNPTDLWGETWTPTDINDTGFGAVISAQTSSGLGGIAQVDFCGIVVYYTTASGQPCVAIIARRPDEPTDPIFTE